MERNNIASIEGEAWYINIQEEKGKWYKGDGGKRSSWNKDQAFSRSYIQCDQRAE
jgi:hypothetical protein